MSKPELGVKRDCPECGARFYDLTKQPAHCPKCDHEFVPEALLKPRRSRAEEEKPKKEDEPEKPEAETTLESADAEKKAPESKRHASLDEDEDDEEEDDELAAIADIGLDDDDDDEPAKDDNLLVDDEEDPVVGIVKPKGDDEL